MNLSIKELNELIYSIGIAGIYGSFQNKELSNSLLDRLYIELNRKIKLQEEYDEIVKNLKADEVVPNFIDEEVDEPEFDSAGSSKEDRYPMHECWCGSYETCDCISEPHDNDGRNSHYVSNEEADEDASKKERGWITQAILDYVDEVGAASYTEMNEFYKAITLGSNSFTHILQNLRTPYKNRKTQRYLAKEGRGGSNAKWVVKIANPSNWVVSDYDYRTFNESPYGND